MKLLFALSFFCSLNFAHATPSDPEVKLWKRAGFENPVISHIDVPVATALEETSGIPPTHALDATIVMFRNSGWTKDSIEAHLKRANEIYTQCGIRMGDMTLVESDPYQGKLDIKSRWTTTGDDFTLAKATPLKNRPIIYLMRDITPNGDREGAFTDIVSFWVPLPEVVQNTIWISSVINEPDYSVYFDMDLDGRSIRKSRDPSYDVVAHEMAHLLADMGHEDLKEKNLLNGASEFLGEHLLPRQCVKFKTSPLLRKISP